jgi:hypothetical protein
MRGPINLTGGSPQVVMYSGRGINSIGQLIPSSLLPGNYTVNYHIHYPLVAMELLQTGITIIPRAARINIYPNPAPDGVLAISATPEMVWRWVRVFNTAGQKVMEWKLAGRLTNYHFKWAQGFIFLNLTKETSLKENLY